MHCGFVNGSNTCFRVIKTRSESRVRWERWEVYKRVGVEDHDGDEEDWGRSRGGGRGFRKAPSASRRGMGKEEGIMEGATVSG